MTSIVRATQKDYPLLASIGRQSFIESHGESASRATIDSYVNEKYNDAVLQEELADVNNIYHLAYHNHTPVGYSKTILNSPHPNIQLPNITKLERLYLLKDYYQLRLGTGLLDFVVNLSKNNHQQGIWLFVWKGNTRAVNFYQSKGFAIIGSYDFRLSETHTNPNHQMFLKY